MRIHPILLGLSLAVVGTSLAAAQDAASPTPPKVIQLQREYLKPGKAGMVHDKSEAAFVATMMRAKLKGHYVALNSMSGKSRALFVVGYPSFAAWEADNKILDKSPALTAEFDHDLMTDGELLDEYDSAVATYNEELSYHPHGDIGHARYFEITVFHVKPGHRTDFEALTKIVKEAHDKAGTSAHWATYEIAYGAEDGTYVVLSADKSMDEIDQGFAESKKFVEGAGGAEGMAKLDKLFGEAVDSSRSELFSINPRQSYASDDWIKADPEFWNAKSAAETATAKPTAKSAAKPSSR
ncbi:MAG: hypothetical protein WCC26_06175 [Terracidiphilus sp.]